MRGFVSPCIPKVDDVLGTVYRVDLSTRQWLRELRSIDVIETRASVAALFETRATGGWRLQEVDASDGGVMFERTRAHWERADSADIVAPRMLCGAQSEAMGVYPLPEPWSDWYREGGVNDCWGLFARGADDAFVCVSHTLELRGRTPRRAAAFWRSVSIHLTAAARLRHALHGSPDAVLSTGGKVLHAEGLAKDPEHRDALRRAARAIDRARTKNAEPLAAIESWTAMVSGRWTLVDEFDADGRRHMVARVNEPKLPARAGLSPRERHVAKLASLGRSNKEIAYELGLAPSSVASLLGRLRRKLGVRRSELIR